MEEDTTPEQFLANRIDRRAADHDRCHGPADSSAVGQQFLTSRTGNRE
jgi:hypothetical protein